MIIKYKKLLGESYSTHEIEISDEEILRILACFSLTKATGVPMDEKVKKIEKATKEPK